MDQSTSWIDRFLLFYSRECTRLTFTLSRVLVLSVSCTLSLCPRETFLPNIPSITQANVCTNRHLNLHLIISSGHAGSFFFVQTYSHEPCITLYCCCRSIEHSSPLTQSREKANSFHCLRSCCLFSSHSPSLVDCFPRECLPLTRALSQALNRLAGKKNLSLSLSLF